MEAFIQRRSIRTKTLPDSPVPEERPVKRVKPTPDHGQVDTNNSPSKNDCSEESDSEQLEYHAIEDVIEDGNQKKHFRHTAIEDSLPAIPSEERPNEYGVPRVSPAFDSDGKTETTKSTWIRGRRSIYVDAFNYALDVVLEDESHLFDAKEHAVFDQWRQLDYESQYLYVRLFLRKTSAWHRHCRLGYYGDISDPEAAIKTLQERRQLPDASPGLSASSVTENELGESQLGSSFTFCDTSEEHIRTIEEAAPLLSLDELKVLCKEAKVQGRNKAELVKALCRMSRHQASLQAVGLQQISGTGENSTAESSASNVDAPPGERKQHSNRARHFMDKISAIVGPCIRLSPLTYELFERLHLVFYRSTEWTEKSLTTIILAKISRRNFPNYIICRTSKIFESREHLVEFERALRLETEVDDILESNTATCETGFLRVLEIFDSIYPRWKTLLAEEQVKEDKVYEFGEGSYLRRFTPAHSYTRILHKAAYALGRLKRHAEEHSLLTELLGQRLFHPARRGSWYQRKALLEENYMHALDPRPISSDPEEQKKHWKRIASRTCEQGLQDNDCHLIYHHGLQKRLVKLEKQLRVAFRQRHDFGHVRLASPEEHTVEGVQLKREDPVGRNRRQASTKTMWLDEHGHGEECSVEEMCLSWYRSQGWKGYHAEGGIIRTLFAYLFYDILFLYIPNVFQTAYQTCPLDLHTDSFYPARASEINHRLVDIANGGAERIIREVALREGEKRTCVVGLNWDYDPDDLVELVTCFDGGALATICKLMAQEYRQRGGGIPDLILWRTEPRRECMFAEVKSANDRLSDTQRLWMHVLTGAGVKVALCNAVAREVKCID
ncbi:coiled-coil domain-containing protein MTMR15 [Sodiomyces alkalinus F11]|uniref:Fanconi-associated nuclease n=1 Tax=Sodiomyces alkalinus (strain CBS 110278 / VKM F-3762 / F11) TaxID=1314773 RepID=A0A3N2PZ09_SODAK|nr:coiled-coil domain-containing protein MTMR15 [Sodiomyces alkalinus F11]ROT39761.1 coiled-coil domain-containing protein MTMR15 [Sodiomyces alkalinus F11]